MASIMALSGGGFYPIASYHASKGGVVHLTRALAVEWGADAIRVNAIAPSWIKTDFNSDFLEQDGIAETLLASVPLKKFGTTQDVAAAVLYLVSPAASMITVIYWQWMAAFLRIRARFDLIGALTTYDPSIISIALISLRSNYAPI
jgi:NAD(P)-dependent dehydrogenase (short-subunit alcohol dehydrogenase family)